MDPLRVDTSGSEVSILPEVAEVRGSTDIVELLPLQGFLNIENPESKSRTQMKEVWDFFAEGSQGKGDALHKLKMTEMKMSPPRLGETRLSKLYNYVKLQSQQKQIEAEMNAL